MSDKYSISTLYEQIENSELIEWLKFILKKDKGLRIEYLTKFATEVELKDVRSKYFTLCRKIRQYHGTNVDSNKKLKGKRMYQLYDQLLGDAQDQIALSRYLEAYEITHAVHTFVYSLYQAEKLNEQGLSVLRRTYEIMNFLSNSPLPPPLIRTISQDWLAILQSGTFKIYDINYTPFNLLFKIYDDETLLLGYLRDQLDSKKYSTDAYQAVRLIFTFGQLYEIQAHQLTAYLDLMHPFQLKRLLSDVTLEKKHNLQKYIIDTVSTMDKASLQQMMVLEKYNFHLHRKEYEEAWPFLMSLLAHRHSEENIHRLLTYIQQTPESIDAAKTEHLRKLIDKMDKKQGWKLLHLINLETQLKESLFQEENLVDIIPFLHYILPAYKKEVTAHFTIKIIDYLSVFHGEKSTEYLEEIMINLNTHGHRRLGNRIYDTISDTYPNRPSIKSFLTSNRL